MSSKRFGLLGETLGHSHSPWIHAHFGYDYHLYPVPLSQLEDWVRQRALDGYNVTMPYKRTVMPWLDHLSPQAEAIGVVNTVVKRNGLLYGFNTDYLGMTYALQLAGINVTNRNVLILGTGATAQTALFVCRRQHANHVVMVSRHPEAASVSRPLPCPVVSYEEVTQCQHNPSHTQHNATVIVNTTPVGLFPNNGERILSLTDFAHLEGVLDVIFNPLVTDLQVQARTLGIPTAYGLDMLVMQALAARDLFTGKAADDSLVLNDALCQEAEALTQSLRRQVSNVVLVGMPGCGKSTVGPLVARLLGKRFVDTDTALEEAAGLSIPTLFATQGQAAFRRQEADLMRTLGAGQGCVVATGGGVVLDPANYLPLKQNGFIVHLERDVNLLPLTNRPLSQSREALQTMWAQREPLYNAFADARVSNQATPEETAQAIVHQFMQS